MTALVVLLVLALLGFGLWKLLVGRRSAGTPRESLKSRIATSLREALGHDQHIPADEVESVAAQGVVALTPLLRSHVANRVFPPVFAVGLIPVPRFPALRHEAQSVCDEMARQSAVEIMKASSRAGSPSGPRRTVELTLLLAPADSSEVRFVPGRAMAAAMERAGVTDETNTVCANASVPVTTNGTQQAVVGWPVPPARPVQAADASIPPTSNLSRSPIPPTGILGPTPGRPVQMAALLEWPTGSKSVPLGVGPRYKAGRDLDSHLLLPSDPEELRIVSGCHIVLWQEASGEIKVRDESKFGTLMVSKSGISKLPKGLERTLPVDSSLWLDESGDVRVTVNIA